jgi:hypothetical protein
MRHVASVWLPVVCAFLAASSGAKAQTPDDIDLSYAQTFVGMCVQSFPDIERVRAGAKALAWPEITDPSIRAMLAPKNPDTKWDAWSFSDGKNTFLATISEVTVQGQRVKACSLFGDGVDTARAYANLNKLISLKKTFEEVQMGQRTTAWSLAMDGQDYGIVAVDGSPMKMKSINISITNYKTNR